MSKLEWFAGLDFGNIEFLISQNDIAESGYSGNTQNIFEDAGENAQMLFFDDFVKKHFRVSSNGMIVTTIRLRATFPFFLASSVVPKIEKLPYENFSVFPGLIGRHLYKCGFRAFYFKKNKVYYWVALNKILEMENV